MADFESKTARIAILETSPVVLGKSWRAVICDNTSITYETLARWERGKISPHPGHVIPRMQLLAKLFSDTTVRFGLLIDDAERFVDACEGIQRADSEATDLETEQCLSLIERFGVAIFGAGWMRPLARYLGERYRIEVSHNSFAVWNRTGMSTRLATDALCALAAGEIARHTEMVSVTVDFKSITDEMTEQFSRGEAYRPTSQSHFDKYALMAA